MEQKVRSDNQNLYDCLLQNLVCNWSSMTCTHDVVSEERGSEPKGQHEQVAAEARVQLSEACGVGAEVGKGSCHQHTMRMEA